MHISHTYFKIALSNSEEMIINKGSQNKSEIYLELAYFVIK